MGVGPLSLGPMRTAASAVGEGGLTLTPFTRVGAFELVYLARASAQTDVLHVRSFRIRHSWKSSTNIAIFTS